MLEERTGSAEDTSDLYKLDGDLCAVCQPRKSLRRHAGPLTCGIHVCSPRLWVGRRLERAVSMEFWWSDRRRKCRGDGGRNVVVDAAEDLARSGVLCLAGVWPMLSGGPHQPGQRATQCTPAGTQGSALLSITERTGSVYGKPAHSAALSRSFCPPCEHCQRPTGALNDFHPARTPRVGPR